MKPKKYTRPFLRREAVRLIQYARSATVPLLQEFCSQRKYSAYLINKFIVTEPLFAEAFQRFKDLQLTRIVKLAMADKINNAMAIFTLKNVAGWRDKDPDQNESNLINNDIEIINSRESNESRLNKYFK